jgi:hypothetical protein
MKRSKLFLGGTAFLLTVAGIMGSKAAKQFHRIPVYTYQDLTNCNSQGSFTATTNTSSGVYKLSGSITTYTVSCQNKLHTRAD